MTDVRVVCDRDPVAAGDDVMANGWSVMVPASMSLSEVMRDHVVPQLADVSGLAEWLVTLAQDMTYRVASETDGHFPTTYHLVGDRCRTASTPVAALLREPDESSRSQILVAMEMLVPDTPVGEVQTNADGDAAFYVKYRSGIEGYADAKRNGGRVVTEFSDPSVRAKIQNDMDRLN